MQGLISRRLNRLAATAYLFQLHALHFYFVEYQCRISLMRDKRARFVELGEARVKKAVQTIRLIGNLSNRNNYEYSDEDAQKIVSALDAELKLLRAKFQANLSKRAADAFRLK